MARGLNKVLLIGNLGQDPELRYTANGTAVCNMRLATNESYKNSEGELVEMTEWHSLVAWTKLAEICGEYLKKGSQVYFEGKLQTRSYEDKDGVTKYVTEVKVSEMMMLGSSGIDSFDSKANQGTRSQRGSKNNTNGASKQRKQAAATYGPDDDLPF